MGFENLIRSVPWPVRDGCFVCLLTCQICRAWDRYTILACGEGDFTVTVCGFEASRRLPIVEVAHILTQQGPLMNVKAEVFQLTPTEFVEKYPIVNLDQLVGYLCSNTDKLVMKNAISFQNFKTLTILINEERLFNHLLFFSERYVDNLPKPK